MPASTSCAPAYTSPLDALLAAATMMSRAHQERRGDGQSPGVPADRRQRPGVPRAHAADVAAHRGRLSRAARRAVAKRWSSEPEPPAIAPSAASCGWSREGTVDPPAVIDAPRGCGGQVREGTAEGARSRSERPIDRRRDAAHVADRVNGCRGIDTPVADALAHCDPIARPAARRAELVPPVDSLRFVRPRDSLA